MNRKSELIHLDPRVLTDINLVAQTLKKKAIDEILLNVNRQARDWLQKEAVKNLNTAIAAHGRPVTGHRYIGPGMSRTQPIRGLRNTIALNGSHVVTSSSVDFMVDSLVRKNAPQYHILEEGYRGFIGKEAPIGFRSGGKLRRPITGSAPVDATIRGAGKVTIKRGIKGYHYVATTVDEFLDREVYEELLESAVVALRMRLPGLKIEIKRGPKARVRVFA